MDGKTIPYACWHMTLRCNMRPNVVDGGADEFLARWGRGSSNAADTFGEGYPEGGAWLTR